MWTALGLRRRVPSPVTGGTGCRGWRLLGPRKGYSALLRGEEKGSADGGDGCLTQEQEEAEALEEVLPVVGHDVPKGIRVALGLIFSPQPRDFLAGDVAHPGRDAVALSPPEPRLLVFREGTQG